MGIEADRERLSQAKLLKWLPREMSITDMVTVYLTDDDGQHRRGIYCALVPTADIEQSLASPTWNLTHGEGYPGAIQHWNGHEKITRYYRYGDDTGVEPLVIDRNFHGMRPDYKELSEEFRLFHRLYHDHKQDHYIKFDDDGKECLVAIVEPNRVQMRLKEIRQFLAIREMHLAIQFDCREHSGISLEELGLKRGGADSRDGLFCWGLHYGDLNGKGSNDRAFSSPLKKST